MKNPKRYSVLMQFYVVAESDEEAIEAVKFISKNNHKKYDDKNRIIEINEDPCGSIQTRNIPINN